MVRSRSNALTGPSDPRFRSPAEISFRCELYKPYAMAPSLTSFLLRVYSDPKIMSGKAATGHTKRKIKTNETRKLLGLIPFGRKKKLRLDPKGSDLADLIYRLYSDSGVDSNSDYSTNKSIVTEIWDAVESNNNLRKGFLQYSDIPLRLLCSFMQSNRPPNDYFSDFIYFPIARSPASTRVYLNVKMDYAAKAAKFLRNYIEQNADHGIVSFKIVGPAAMQGRADTVVCYCSQKQKAEKLAREVAKLDGHFNPEVPGMTSKIADGVALGAEPVQQATGLGQAPEGYPESSQSFGTIRSQLIAGAVLNFNDNKRIFGDTFDVFSKFVAVAFRGYGLDPAHPGD